MLGFDLPPLLAVGMMLLAASPGGTTANLYSHLFRGDVALNITLTAINSVHRHVTLPIIVNLALSLLRPDDERRPPVGKVVEVFAIVLVPVAVGMLVRDAGVRPLPLRMEKPVRIGSAVILAVPRGGSLVDRVTRTSATTLAM